MTIELKDIEEKIQNHHQQLQEVLARIGQINQEQENLSARRFGLIGAIESLGALKGELENPQQDIPLEVVKEKTEEK